MRFRKSQLDEIEKTLERFVVQSKVRLLDALKILEAATIECKTREIDTPEVREALELLARTAGRNGELPAFGIT